MMKNTAGPAQNLVVNMMAMAEFQKTKFHEMEFYHETTKWQL